MKTVRGGRIRIFIREIRIDEKTVSHKVYSSKGALLHSESIPQASPPPVPPPITGTLSNVPNVFGP